MDTNANSPLLAALLKTSSGSGTTFTGLITRKQGKVVKGVRYGDDLVHTVVVTGFKYSRLVERSLAALPKLKAADIIADAARHGKTITEADVEAARGELQVSFEASLAGESESTTENVYETLTVNGDSVKSGRVYKCVSDKGIACHCRKCSGDEKQPLDGTIYLQGLKIWSKVLEAAPNGPIPEPKSAPKTIAKDALRYRLPVGRYTSYRLEPGTEFMLAAGGNAEVEATKKGFVVTDDLVATLQQVA